MRSRRGGRPCDSQCGAEIRLVRAEADDHALLIKAETDAVLGEPDEKIGQAVSKRKVQ